MNNTEEFVWKLCFEKVVEKFGHGDFIKWTNREYQLLSDEILKETKLNISISSLKRILGKIEYIYKPQQETKNALAKYIGYLNWEDFVINCKYDSTPNITPVLTPNKLITKRHLLLFSSISLVIIIAALIYTFTGKEKLTFSVVNNKGNAPFLVSFKYDISKAKNKKIEINYDDLSFLDHDVLSPQESQINFSFRTPDVYYVRFLEDDKEIKRIPITAWSNGWFATICNYDIQGKNILKSLTDNDTYKHDGIMHVSPLKVCKYGYDTLVNYWIKYRNIRDFKLDGKAFEYEIKVRNKIKKQDLIYPEAVLSVMGDKNKITAVFRYPGTNGKWATYSFSEKEIKSEKQNMDAFNCNLNEWHIIKLFVKDKVIHFYIDSKEIYSVTYLEDLGNINGLMLQTNGSGEFDYVKLFNENHQLVYSDDFN